MTRFVPEYKQYKGGTALQSISLFVILVSLVTIGAATLDLRLIGLPVVVVPVGLFILYFALVRHVALLEFSDAIVIKRHILPDLKFEYSELDKLDTEFLQIGGLKFHFNKGIHIINNHLDLLLVLEELNCRGIWPISEP